MRYERSRRTNPDGSITLTIQPVTRGGVRTEELNLRFAPEMTDESLVQQVARTCLRELAGARQQAAWAGRFYRRRRRC